MSKVPLLLAICLTSTAALPDINQGRIVGGTVATASEYPYIAKILYASDHVNYRPVCVGAIINNRSILTGRVCWSAPNNQVLLFLAQVGYVNATNIGSLHSIAQLIQHSSYNSWNQAHSLGILRVTTIIYFGTYVRPIPLAPLDYTLPDHENVVAIGLSSTTATSELQLNAVELRTINQDRCEMVYGMNFLSPDMVCAGWETGGRGLCHGDIGAPLVHNNVLVGITAYTHGCGDGNFPSVFTRLYQPMTVSWLEGNS